MSLLSKILLFLIAIALATVAGINTYTFVHFTQAPFIVTASEITNSPVQFGEDVIIRYTADRQTLCKTDTDVFVLQVPEELLVHASRRPAGVIPLGTSSWKVHISTMGMVPGKYVLRFFVHSDCGDRLHTIEVPDLPFEVTE